LTFALFNASNAICVLCKINSFGTIPFIAAATYAFHTFFHALAAVFHANITFVHASAFSVVASSTVLFFSFATLQSICASFHIASNINIELELELKLEFGELELELGLELELKLELRA
jgi:hypothetical protein